MLHNPNLDIWYTQSSMFFRRNSWNTHAISFQRLWCESSCCSLNSRDGFPRSLSHAGLVIQLHPRLLLNMENDTIAPSVTFCYSCESLATILCSFCAWQVFPNVAVVGGYTALRMSLGCAYRLVAVTQCLTTIQNCFLRGNNRYRGGI